MVSRPLSMREALGTAPSVSSDLEECGVVESGLSCFQARLLRHGGFPIASARATRTRESRTRETAPFNKSNAGLPQAYAARHFVRVAKEMD